MHKILFLIPTLVLLCCTGCYRMPAEDECSLVPGTNNPDITRESNRVTMPGMNI